MTSPYLIGSIQSNQKIDGYVLQENRITGNISSFAGFVSDYRKLTNKPEINGVQLEGNKTTSDLNITEVLLFENIYFFPNIGKSQNIYIARNTDKSHRWDDIDKKYFCIGSNYEDISVIDGGKA